MSIVEVKKVNMYAISVHQVYEDVENEQADKELRKITTVGSNKEIIKQLVENMIVEELIDIFNKCHEHLYRYETREIIGCIYAINENEILKELTGKLETMSDESIIRKWKIPPYKVNKKYSTKKPEDFERRQTVTYSFSPKMSKKILANQLIGVTAKKVDLKSQMMLKYIDIIENVISSRNF